MDEIKESLRSVADIFIKEFEEKNKNCFYDAFKQHFNDRTDFDSFLGKINAENRFKIIRLGIFYDIITKEIKHAGIIGDAIFSFNQNIQG